MCVYALALAFLFFTWSSRIAWALEPQVPGYVHRVWTTEQGLPQNTIGTLLTSRDGYLWIGSGNGLHRFDGLTFTTFTLANTPALRSNWIQSLHEAADGTLWIGTSKGLAKHRGGVFAREEGDSRLSDDLIRTIHSDRQGGVFAASSERVYQRQPNGRWTQLPLEATTEGIGALMVDRRGSIWIGVGRRLVEWHGQRSRRVFTTRDGLPAADITALAEDRAGRLWIGTSRGVASLDPDAGRLVAGAGALEDVQVYRLFVDRDQVLWVGALRRIVTRSPDGQIAIHAVAAAEDDAPVGALTQDAGGQVWYGLGGGSGGLHRLTRARVTTYTRDQGLPCENIAPVTAGSDGKIWFGTFCSENASLNVLERGRARTYSLPPGRPTYISALLALPDGELLVGTTAGELLRFMDGRFTPLAGPLRPHLSYIRVLFVDDQGALWVGTADGLSRHYQGEWRTWRAEDGLASNEVTAIIPGPRNTLWIGNNGGVTRYENGRFTAYGESRGMPPSEVRALHLDRDGALWIGTRSAGLARLKQERVTRFDSYEGLLDVTVHRIIEDDRGDLWLSGDRGIRRVSRGDLNGIADSGAARPRVDILDTANGMKNAECNGIGQPAGVRTADGAIWFPSQGGLVRVDPSDALTGAPTPVSIESVLVNSVAQPLAGVIEIPPGVRDLEVRYTSPALMRPEHVTFRYRMVGRNDGWVDVGPQRVVHFASLAPGDYQLEVAARGVAGDWGEKSATIRLVLQPYFHQRLVFKVAAGVALVAAAALGVWMRLRRLGRRAAALEAVVAARTGELTGEREELRETLRELHVAKSGLEEAHTHLLATFNHLRVGVILLDADRRVRFISEATRPLLGPAGERDVIGQPIERVLPIDADTMPALSAQIRTPRPGIRLTARLAPAAHQRYFTEIEVQPDVADPDRRVVYLYDVTETYDLKRALDAGTKGVAANLLGDSVAMRAIKDEIGRVAGLDTTILIEGETGTGKELVARAIHEASPRKHRPFVAINCAGLTESILTSQLFGHRRGAFTDALSDHVGLFEAANGGTLLLDEIGDMPVGVQTHLLRVLQEREILRLGENKPRGIDVRVLAATHRNLDAEVAQGRFRQDLLYRIRVVRLHLPPLRQRRSDIPLLAATFLQQIRVANNLSVDEISREAIAHLQAHGWPGNVRELKATVESAAIRATGAVVRLSDLALDAPLGEIPPVQRSLTERDRRQIIDALRETGGNRTAAARLLRVARSTLYRRLAQLEAEGIELPPDPSK